MGTSTLKMMIRIQARVHENKVRGKRCSFFIK